jgi:hypothetical protein
LTMKCNVVTKILSFTSVCCFANLSPPHGWVEKGKVCVSVCVCVWGEGDRSYCMQSNGYGLLRIGIYSPGGDQTQRIKILIVPKMRFQISF